MGCIKLTKKQIDDLRNDTERAKLESERALRVYGSLVKQLREAERERNNVLRDSGGDFDE